MGTLNRASKQALYDAGFTLYEIDIFDNATTPNGELQPPIDISTPVWQDVIEKRRQRVERIQESHIKDTGKRMARNQVSRILNLWYIKHPKADPFDWLKRAYRRLKHMTGKKLKKATRKLQGFPGARKYTVKTSFD